MAKDPAFLFYPGDWIAGTMHLNLEEKGAYIELLMLQFNVGHMTKHMIGRMLGQRVDKVWSSIVDKFEIDEEGKYYNVRLEEEKIKRKAYTQSRINNRTGKNQYSKDNKKRGHMSGHMENENENENRDINRDVDKNEKPKIFSVEIENTYRKCLKYFPAHLHPQNPDLWKETIDKLNRIENLPFEVIEDVVEKTRNNDFWAKNFLSLTKLRKKNKDGILYVVVFAEQFKKQSNGITRDWITEMVDKKFKERGVV